MSEVKMNDLGEKWVNWILDMKNLKTHFPDNENASALMLYGVNLNNENIAVGHFVVGKDILSLNESLYQLIKDNTQLLAIFFDTLFRVCNDFDKKYQKELLTLLRDAADKQLELL